MKSPNQNKAIQPSSNKAMVWVKINENGMLKGIGDVDDVLEMEESLAEKYERDGYLTILKEK